MFNKEGSYSNRIDSTLSLLTSSNVVKSVSYSFASSFTVKSPLSTISVYSVTSSVVTLYGILYSNVYFLHKLCRMFYLFYIPLNSP